MRYKVSIIILNYKSYKELEKCIKSLIETHDRNFVKNLEFIIVNNSYEEKDKLNRILIKYKPLNMKVYHNKINTYFLRGIYQGIKKSSGDYLLFLNSDIIFKDKNTLKKMLMFLQKNKEYVALTCKVIDLRLKRVIRSASNRLYYIDYFLSSTTIAYMLYMFGIKNKVIRRMMLDYNFNKSADAIDIGNAIYLIRRKDLPPLNLLIKGQFLYTSEDIYGHYFYKLNKKQRYFAETYVLHKTSHSSRSLNEKLWAIKVWDMYHFIKSHFGKVKAVVLALSMLLSPLYIIRIHKILHWIPLLSKENKEINEYLKINKK